MHGTLYAQLAKEGRVHEPNEPTSIHAEAGLRYPNRLGPAVRAKREELGLTQRELASQLGRSQHTISRLELSNPDSPVPPAELLNPLAAALRTTVAELLRAAGYAVEPPEITVEETTIVTPELIAEWVQRAQGLAPGAQRIVIEALQLGRPAGKTTQDSAT